MFNYVINGATIKKQKQIAEMPCAWKHQLASEIYCQVFMPQECTPK